MRTYLIIGLMAMATLISCTKMDDYKSFQGDREIYYPGILDSARIYSGNKRVLLWGLFTSDPKIAKYRVYWNGRENFIEKEIVRSSGIDTVSLFINDLNEGGISFEIRTFDKEGHISVPINVSGIVYGDNYANGIINRGYNRSTTTYNATTKVLTIDWVSVDPTAIFTAVEYTNTANQKKTIRVTDPEATKTFISDYKQNTDVSYHTAYLPNKTAIDTFYVNKKEVFKR